MSKPVDKSQEKEEFEKLWRDCDKSRQAKSHNDKSELSDSTKLVIVGTLTPPNTKYFYCSHSNRIYGYLDEALKNEDKTLKGLKEGLSSYEGHPVLSGNEIDRKIEKIKEILVSNHIAFLDVMDRAIRKEGKADSPYDKDIQCYTLANDKFSVLKNREGITIIPNSRLAEKGLLNMGFVKGSYQ